MVGRGRGGCTKSNGGESEGTGRVLEEFEVGLPPVLADEVPTHVEKGERVTSLDHWMPKM